MIYMEKHNKAFDKNIIKYSRKTGNNNKKTDATSKIKEGTSKWESFHR